jgi:cytochrome c
MTFAGLSNPQDRANVLAYINSQGSSLPLPAAPAAGAAGAADDKAKADTGGNTAAATNAVDTDKRGETGDIANTGTAASGAPSVDPEAARKGARSE